MATVVCLCVCVCLYGCMGVSIGVYVHWGNETRVGLPAETFFYIPDLNLCL